MELWDALYWQKKKEELPLLSKKNLLRALSHSDLRQWVLSKYTRIWDSISLHWQIIHKVWQCIDNWTIEKQLFPKYTLGKYTLGNTFWGQTETVEEKRRQRWIVVEICVKSARRSQCGWKCDEGPHLVPISHFTFPSWRIRSDYFLKKSCYKLQHSTHEVSSNWFDHWVDMTESEPH